MVSLARLWRSHGLVPSAVVGSSQGEIAAACVAGALSLHDAVKIVVLRSRLFADELRGNGAVVSVAAPEAEVRARLAAQGDGTLHLGGVNGPHAVTVVGALPALERFVADATRDGLRARLVASSVASHCDQVDPLRSRILDLFADVTPTRTDVAFCSTVSGSFTDTAALDAAYWFDNARRPVAFDPAVRTLLDAGHRFFVEISPHPVLVHAVQDIAEDAGTDAAVVATLRRGQETSPASCAPSPTPTPAAHRSTSPGRWTAGPPPGSTCRPTPSSDSATGRSPIPPRRPTPRTRPRRTSGRPWRTTT